VRPVRVLVVAASVALGALFAIGFLISALFEVQGFGGPRDQGPRAGYLLELAIGVVACVGVPILLWRRLLGGGPGWVAAGAVSTIFVLAIVGITRLA
jgi:hypothetical protein